MGFPRVSPDTNAPLALLGLLALLGGLGRGAGTLAASASFFAALRCASALSCWA
jgi:hypothetical protein